MSSLGLRKAARQRAVIAICRARGIDDDTRRDIQAAQTGKASLKEMNLSDLNKLLDHLNDKSDTPENEWKFVFRLAPDRQALGRKIYKLAERLGPFMSPPVPLASKDYIEGIAGQMRSCATRLEFCDAAQLLKIVQALEIHLNRIGG